MKQPAENRSKGRALVLAPELPGLGKGGGALRTECLVQYLRQRYVVDVVTFQLSAHSKSHVARVWRNAVRFLRGRPPLFDRYSGYQAQITSQISGRQYDVAVVEHFWCASYAPVLRPFGGRLVLDLHNIESELARTHGRSLSGPAGWVSERFAVMYRRLEQEWLPRFDTLLVTSEVDRARVATLCPHNDVRVFPNALPEVPLPEGTEAQAAIVFSGNLEYHPNVEAVRWFRTEIWPKVREQCPQVSWNLVGRNQAAVLGLVQGDPRILVVGPVDDAVVALAAAHVCVVPLLSGSGTRFKILEAWAAGRAVVSTSLGAEGLGATDGVHLLIADDADRFSDAVIRLLGDARLRTQLGAAGRSLYEDQFTWSTAWGMLDQSGGL